MQFYFYKTIDASGLMFSLKHLERIGETLLATQATPNVHEACHLPGAALPNEFGNQRKEKNRKTTCEQPASHTTWSSRKE